VALAFPEKKVYFPNIEKDYATIDHNNEAKDHRNTVN